MSWSCTHKRDEPPTIGAEPGQILKYNSCWFGRFWIGPDMVSLGGPIVFSKVMVPVGTVLKLGKRNGSCYKPVIYETNKSEGLFEEVTVDGEITGQTMSLDEAHRTWPNARVFFVPPPRPDP